MDHPDSLDASHVPARRPWWRRLFLGAVLTVLVMIGAAAAFYVHLVHAADEELRQAIAEVDRLEADGWRLEDIEARREVLPDERNVALVVLAARKLMPPTWPTPAEVSLGLNELSPGDGLAPHPVRLASLQERLDAQPREFLLDELTLQEARRELERAFPALPGAHRVVDLCAGRYPRAQRRSAIRATGCVDAMEVAELVGMEALLWAHDGSPDSALRSGRCVLHVARSIGDEPAMASMLIRLFVDEVAIVSLERTLALGLPSDEELKSAQRLLEEEAEQPLLWIGARGERACFHEMLRALVAGEIGLNQLSPDGGPNARERLATRLMAYRFKRSHAKILRLTTELVEASKLPVEQQRERLGQVERSVDEAAAEDTLVRLMVQAVVKVVKEFRKTLAKARCAAAGLAAERYRQHHGCWPGSLDELVHARLIGAVAVDPYDGSPLRYRRIADGVVVYSVGIDGKDDGGDLGDRFRARGSDLGFRLWDVDKRRQPPHEEIPPPREEEEGPNSGSPS